MKHFFVSFVVEGKNNGPKEITREDGVVVPMDDIFTSHGNIVYSVNDVELPDGTKVAGFIISDAEHRIHAAVSSDIPNQYIYKVTVLNYIEIPEDDYKLNRFYNDSLSANRADEEESSGSKESAGHDQENEKEAA